MLSDVSLQQRNPILVVIQVERVVTSSVARPTLDDGLTHSTCDRNVSGCLRDAAKKRADSFDRVVIEQMIWLENLSGKLIRADAICDCEERDITGEAVPGSWNWTEAEECLLCCEE